jgi:hypothetical protein
LSEAVTGQYFELPVAMKPERDLEAWVGFAKRRLQFEGWQYHATSTELQAFVADRSSIDVTGPAVTEAQALEKATEVARGFRWTVRADGAGTPTED